MAIACAFSCQSGATWAALPDSKRANQDGCPLYLQYGENRFAFQCSSLGAENVTLLSI
jgi:hypothetical protein